MLNDLLDPARANLKLREDPAKGFFVENLKEETLVSVDHALSVIAAGDGHRKVCPSKKPTSPQSCATVVSFAAAFVTRWHDSCPADVALA